ncbi:hypothetical protein [Amycolatopsis magusensis]|uniref:Alpha amylase inhibitor n=1 Tax=Amycolatopsis magusensis TaxID=882444 RepID=A0ABS4PZ25_9PSEU|nr:hypothetical protein [Amycolatopsis magusensis]MBP2184118.1 hypothetical protein [Amycolatopsis magusensis]MDI5976535.1 hypothetical protein [Amycolatopsis magusensis]
MERKVKAAAAVAAFALAGLGSGTMAASAAPAPAGGGVTIQAECQWFVIKRNPQASASATCTVLDSGYTRFRVVIECAEGGRLVGNASLRNGLSSQRCPANSWMSSNGPWIEFL